MNYKEENVKLGTKLVNKLNDKYSKDGYEPVVAKKVIDKVCFSNLYAKDHKKNYLYLSKLLSYVDSKIENGEHSNLIFAALETVAQDAKRKIRSGEITMEEIQKKKTEKFKSDTEKCISYLLQVLEENNYSREDLEMLEDFEVQKSKNQYSYFKDKASRGKIIGSLNKGFFSFNNTELEQFIKDHNGKCNKNDRFISIMPDDILKYKIVLMHISNSYAPKGKKENYTLKMMRDKNEILGGIARAMYIKDTLRTPDEQMLNSAIAKKEQSKTRKKQLKGQIKMKI